MKATYSGFEAKRGGGFVDLPPVGAYVAEIQAVRLKDSGFDGREAIELFIEIVEGEYKNRFHDVFEDQKEKFGETVKYKGIFRLVPPADGDEDWRKRTFEGNIWCVQESNPGYTWDWDEKKLKGKKVGISIRKRIYNFNGKDRETTEIGRFETVDDVRNGKCKPMKDRDTRSGSTSSAPVEDASSTNVTGEVEVPW